MDFIPSQYQQKILDYFITNINKNLLVNALAGSGKSSTACLLTEHSKTLDIYIAFNSSVVAEFKNKIKNPKTKVMTIHSLAYSIMLYNVEQEKPVVKKSGFGTRGTNPSKVTLDNFKPYKILDDLITKEYGKYIPFTKRVFLKDSYVSLYNLCRLTLTNMSINTDVQNLIKDHTLFEYYGEEGYSAPPIEEITSTLKTLDAKSQDLFETERVIDFTDMIWITYNKLLSKEWSVPYWAMYTNIYVDECQDFSNIQLNFLKFIKHVNGRYIFIGDFHQAIYNFAGSNAQAFKQIPKMFAPVEEFDLPVCYRCAKSHLARVNREYNIPILPRDDAPEGFIKTIEKKDIINYVQAGDMIISRKNKWVAPVILDLAKKGIPVYIEDKEMVTSIKKLIDSSKAKTVRGLRTSLKDIVNSFNKKLRELILKDNQVGEENNEEAKLQAVTSTTAKIDNVNFVLEILDGYEENHSLNDTTQTFSSFITHLLNTTPSPDCVRLCSIHKAKGLEAENVFVLNEAKINYDFRNSKEQNVQEKNLSYIATTRAKNGLYLVKETAEDANKKSKEGYLNDF